MADFAVSTVFRGKDKISKNFRDMDKGAARFGRTAKKSFRDATASASRFRDVTKGILAAGAVSRGLGLLTRGLGDLTRQFIDFDQATIGATARFKDIGPEAANFEDALRKVRDRAREAGATTEFTAAQSAAALDFLARAGWDSAQAFGGLNSMINLATATGEDFARVADISSDLMGSFGLNTEDAVQQLKNLNRLNDVLVKTVNSTNVTMENLFDTMTQIGPIAKGVLGASLEDVASLTGALGNAGIKGSQAMTALKNAYLRLAAPVGDGADLLKFLNVTLDDGAGGARTMTDIMAELGGKIGKLGKVQQAEALNLIFGKRAIAGGKNIIDNIANINKLRKSLENAGGTAAATAERMRQSLGNRLITLGSAATEFGFKIFEVFGVQGKEGIDKLTESIREFNVEPLIFGIGMGIDMVKNLFAVLRPFKEIIGVLVGAWLAYAAVMKIVAAAQAIVALTNPITLLIATVAIGAALLVEFWDEIGMGWTIMLKGMEKTFFKIVGIFSFIWGGLLKGFLVGMKKVADFFGRDTSGIDTALAELDAFQADIEVRGGLRTPPNQEEAAARQEAGFRGRIDIAGAPEGSTAEVDTFGSADIEMGMMGGA